MSEINNSSSDQSAAKLLSKELVEHCKAWRISEECLREIIERHGLTANIRIRKYDFFYEACRNRRVTVGIIRCLLEYFPDAATADEIGWTPLHYACGNRSVTKGIIKVLFEASPDSVRRTNVMGMMPLHCLCANQKVDEETAIQILKLLIEKYPEAVRHVDNNYGRLPIHIASRWRSPEFYRVLIEAYPGSERVPDVSDGRLPLHHVCLNGRWSLKTVELLYRRYPDAIDHAACGGRRHPIHEAVLGMRQRDKPAAAVKIVQFLLDCDHSQALIEIRGKSLLYFACRERREFEFHNLNMEAAIQMIKIIFDAHPEAIEDNRIESTIQRHRLRYHLQPIHSFINGELVYARQAKDHLLMTTPDDNGRLPLHLALQNNVRLGSIKLLVKGNPQALQSNDNNGALPLHVACQHHDSNDVIDFLAGLDPSTLDAVDGEGNTALHLACCGAKYDMIAMLLEKYDAVSVSKRNAHGELPIDLLWESICAVGDRESIEYTESVYRLLKAYPETVMI